MLAQKPAEVMEVIKQTFESESTTVSYDFFEKVLYGGGSASKPELDMLYEKLYKDTPLTLLRHAGFDEGVYKKCPCAFALSPTDVMIDFEAGKKLAEECGGELLEVAGPHCFLCEEGG